MYRSYAPIVKKNRHTKVQMTMHKKRVSRLVKISQKPGPCRLAHDKDSPAFDHLAKSMPLQTKALRLWVLQPVTHGKSGQNVDEHGENIGEIVF